MSISHVVYDEEDESMLVPAVLKVTVKYFFPQADSMAQGMGWNLRERNSRAEVQTAPMSATESRYDENEIRCCEGSSRSESNCHSATPRPLR
jgi:hypothetical protein